MALYKGGIRRCCFDRDKTSHARGMSSRAFKNNAPDPTNRPIINEGCIQPFDAALVLRDYSVVPARDTRHEYCKRKCKFLDDWLVCYPGLEGEA